MLSQNIHDVKFFNIDEVLFLKKSKTFYRKILITFGDDASSDIEISLYSKKKEDLDLETNLGGK